MPVTGALRAAKDLLEARGIDDNDRKLRYILAFHRITSYGCLLARQAARTGNEGNLADICRKGRRGARRPYLRAQADSRATRVAGRTPTQVRAFRGLRAQARLRSLDFGHDYRYADP